MRSACLLTNANWKLGASASQTIPSTELTRSRNRCCAAIASARAARSLASSRSRSSSARLRLLMSSIVPTNPAGLPASVSCSPLQDEAGSPAGFVGTIEDISNRKRADDERERLLASERAALAEAMAAQQRFRDLVNSVEGIVWEADAPSFQFAFVSKQAERILGYPVERWLSEPTFWSDHLHPDDRECAVRFREEALADKRDHDFEYRMIAADGRVVWVRDLVTVVVQGDRATRLRGVMVDITERKRAEEERHAHLWFFESMDRINRAIQGTNDLEQMMSDVLDEVLSIFNCDR